MRQSVVTVKRITDKINKVTTIIDDIEKTMSDLSDRRTEIEHEMGNVVFAIKALSELETTEDISVKIRELESKIVTHRIERDKYTDSISKQQPYLEKYLYTKEMLESLLDVDSETIAVRRPSPPFEPYPEFVKGLSKEGSDWENNSLNSEEEE